MNGFVRKDTRSLFVRAQVTMVALSANYQQRMGETHPNAIYSDELVEAIRDAYEAGSPPEGVARTRYNCVGYKRLAVQFDVPVRTVREICNYEKRVAWAERWKRLDKL